MFDGCGRLRFWHLVLGCALMAVALTSAGNAAPKAKVKMSRAVAVSVVNLPWRGVKNGWGPVEMNGSNGGELVHDGKPLRINNKRYALGFGCHVASEIEVPLNGRYGSFVCDIGFDDDVKWQKPVDRKTRAVFKVFADNRQLFDSGPMTANTPTKTIRVGVRGKKLLRLVVRPIGDGRNGHVDWANPRLLP